MSAIKNTSRLTMTILGCGNMGISILRGIMSSQTAGSSQKASQSFDRDNNTTSPFFSRFIACVNRPESVLTTQKNLFDIGASSVDVWQGRNVEAVRNADVILLSCQPSQAAGIVSGPEMANALSGKILLSICVGLTVPQVEALINQGDGSRDSSSGQSRCVIIHAMPNTASTIRESSTIISHYPEQSSPAVSEIVQHVFSSIGKIITVPSTLMSAASVTAASTPAFFALALEGVIEGAIAKGISREDATVMAAQAMKGTAGMVLEGEEPKEVLSKVMTPNGCTERGVQVLRGGGVSDIYTEATTTAIERVFEMSRERNFMEK
ncbi:hypothetical protein VMCG_04939 [Cytospora schulzeri]|uniref:Pyrroline-5-carboxylate reductase n=1 Tax=Cytospora schulzeri TaxID=448051 RepID=A0A423WM45_9PEZI|nr:hypothetical protein VMCG_04939 [Valsa malicola]